MKKYNYIDYLMMFLFLAVSGGQYFCIFYGRFFIPIFLLLSLYYHFRRYHGIKYFTSLWYILIGCSYSTIHYLLIYPDHEKNTFIPSILMLIAAYLFLSSLTLSRFRRLYLNTVSVMAAISIFIFLIVEGGLVSPSVYSKGGLTSVMFLFHHMGNPSLFGRLAGIYWEPGAYQIVLNMVFILYSDVIIKREIGKSLRIKFLIILIAVLLTKSTAGYLMILALLSYWGGGILMKHFSLQKIIMVVSVGVAASWFIYNSDAVQKKISQRELGYANSSYTIREADNMAMLKMISERPIEGFGIDSKDFIYRGTRLGSRTYSNGVLLMIVCLGIPFFIFYLFFIIMGIKRLYPNNSFLLILFLFLFINSFEVFWFYPVAFILHFLREDKTMLLHQRS